MSSTPSWFRRNRRKIFFGTGVLAGIVAALLWVNLVPNDKDLREPLVANYGIDDPQFPRSMSALLGPVLTAGNSTTELINGDQIFPAMLEGIRGAQRTITFETFIYWSGAIGREFADALAERAQHGVRVLILLDYLGSSRMNKTLLDELQTAGCEIVKFHAPKWNELSEFNNRTHRKLLVVDGRTGFTGGVGIADEWSGHAQDPNHWRDTHFRVEGPVVAQMQGTFMANWVKAHGSIEHDESFFPKLEPKGTQLAQMFHSSPDEGGENVRLMYLLSIAAARRSILLEQAYFLPDDLATAMLISAARRGVRVEVIVPGPLIDTKLVRRASRSRWGDLLTAGVHIYEYQPTNFHCKVMIVDGHWASVGSTNFDNRSFILNDEANLNVYDSAFGAQLERTFAQDKGVSREITLTEWKNRSWFVKAWEKFWSLFRAQM
jgi:cardiolipin synthase